MGSAPALHWVGHGKTSSFAAFSWSHLFISIDALGVGQLPLKDEGRWQLYLLLAAPSHAGGADACSACRGGRAEEWRQENGEDLGQVIRLPSLAIFSIREGIGQASCCLGVYLSV